MTKDVLNVLTNKLDKRVAQVTKKLLIEILEDVNDSRSMPFVWGALNIITSDMPM